MAYSNPKRDQERKRRARRGTAALTRSQRVRMVRDWDRGEGMQELARRYDVPVETVHEVVRETLEMRQGDA